MADFWQQLAGKAGAGINLVGQALGNPLPDYNISESLQSFGGNKSSQPFAYVPPSLNRNASSGQVMGASTPNYSTAPLGTGSGLYSTAPGTSPTGGQRTAQTALPTGSPQQTQSGGQDPAQAAYFSYLDQQAGLLPETQSNLEAQVNNLFGSSQSSIEGSQAGSLAELENTRGKVTSNKAASLRDLEQNMRSQLTAGQRMLGGIPGAASSTASNMYSYALTKEGNKNRTQLQRQANELYSNIDLQANKVKQTAQDQLNQLNTWKNNELLKISQYIQQQRGMIDQAKQQYIQDYLGKIDAQATSYRQALTEWAMNNSTNLDQLRNTLMGFTQGLPTGFNQPNLPGLSTAGGATGGADYFGLLSPQKKQTVGY